MGYPGDQQKHGGWGSQQSPYDPAEDQTTHGESAQNGSHGESSHGGSAPYGASPYDDSSYGGSQSGSSFGDSYASSPYGGPQGGSSHDAPYGPGSSYGSEPGSQYGGGPGPYGGSAFGSEPPGAPVGGPGGGPGGGPAPYDPDEDGLGSTSSKKPLIIGAAVVAGVVVIGGGTALALNSGGGGAKPAPTPPATTRPAAPPPPNPTPTPTETGRGDRLQSRSTDARPLTLNEVFKARTFKAGGRGYTMTTRRSDRRCVNGTHGAAFQKAIAKGGCSQVLRATFSNGKLIGTIGVLNLKTQAAADAVQTASRPKDAYIVPLPGVGTTSKIGQGLSLTTAEVDGHYLILSWVQYPNGKRITKGDYPAVTAFVQGTTLGSNLRAALNYRSMEGKPS